MSGRDEGAADRLAGAPGLADIAATLDAALPRLRGVRPLARSLKCLLLAAELDGRPAVIKWLARREPPWPWYFARERALLAGFAAAGEGEAVPEILSYGPCWMALARIEGEALAVGRLAREADARAVAAALRARRRLAATAARWPTAVMDAATRAEVRARLLEDPCDGLGWCVEGLARGAELGLLERADADLAAAALRAWPVLARSHGDLLPRNVLVAGGEARLVDLECAGDYPEAWDHALLWANLPAALRPRVEDDFGVEADERGRSFLACCVFALVRELKFARGRRLADALRETLRGATAALRAGRRTAE